MFPTDPGRWTFTASGSSGSFNVNAPVYDAAALALYAVDTDGILYEPTAVVTPAVDRSGATVTVASGLTSGDRVIVYRVPKLTQLEPLPASGPLPPKLVGRQLDRAFADLVAIANMARRSIRAPLADDDGLGEMPTAALRANGIVGFDTQGALTVLNLVPLSPAVPVSTYMQTLLLAVSAAAMRNTLGFSAWFQTLIGTTDVASLVAAIGAEDLRDTLDVERANGMSIQGLLWSKNGANTLDITAGGAMSDDGVRYLEYAGGTALAIGTLFAAGGLLDTGAIANGNYKLWLVRNPTTGVVKPLATAEASTPAWPAGYTQHRLFGFVERAGGAITACKVIETAGSGVYLEWTQATLDVNVAAGLNTTRRTDPLRVPLTFSVWAKVNALISDVTAPALAWIHCPDQTSAAPSGTLAPLANMALVAGAGIFDQRELRIRTNANGEIAAVANIDTIDFYKVVTIGFEWSRR